MKRRAARPWTALVLAVLASLTIAWDRGRERSTADANPSASDRFGSALDAETPKLLATHAVAGAVVSCIRKGAVVWTRAYGLADIETRAPMLPETVFHHGSAGKTLTAWAVMRLVEAGRVELDAPIDRYLKRWHLPPSGFDTSQVTVRRALSHTGGLDVAGYTGYSLRRPLPSIVAVLDGANQLDGAVQVASLPGSAYRYSGGGYAVLQLLVEDVTGEPFASFVEREILAPLHLSSGAFRWTPTLKARAATPYGFWSDRLPYYDFAVPAIGSYACSVQDFARFVAAAVPGPNGEEPGRAVLSAATVASMMEAQPGSGGSYGLGYAVEAFPSGHRYVLHKGHSSGWHTLYALDPKTGSGFVIAANSDSANPVLWGTLDLWSETEMDEPAKSDPALLAASNQVPWFSHASLAAAVVVGLAGVLRGRRALQGQGRHPRRVEGSRGRLFVGAIVLAMVIWTIAFHTNIPLPLPSRAPEVRWPGTWPWVTASVFFLGVVEIVRVASTPRRQSS